MNTVTSRDGTPIAYDRHGSGPAVIFVGPALADRSAGTPLSKELASRFTAFNYDRRGRGDSGDVAPYAVEREVEDIEAMLKVAGGSAFVIGGSSGAILALDAAAACRGIKKLAVYEPPFIVDHSRPAMPATFLPQLKALIAAGRRREAVDLYMTLALQVPPQALAAMHAGPTWSEWEARAHTLVYDFSIIGDTESGRPLPPKRWAALDAPTLVLDGGASPAFMHTGAQALAELLPHATRRTLPEQTHAVDVKLLAGVLTEFYVA